MHLGQMAAELGGKITNAARLPDGSGCAVMSLPLPKDHWSLVSGDNEPPAPFRMGNKDEQRNGWEDKIRTAGKYAFRASTMNGKEPDLDPDALLQNLVVGMLGYNTNDGFETELEEALSKWVMCSKCSKIDKSTKQPPYAGTKDVMRCPNCDRGDGRAGMCRACCPTGHATREINFRT
jgi:hypothetical protein